MAVNVLIKKRDQLNQKIADFHKAEKRKAAIASLAQKSGILDIPDELLKIAFKNLAASYKDGSLSADISADRRNYPTAQSAVVDFPNQPQS
jgi:hypothetical protein